MLFGLAFHYDPRFRDQWEQLARTYDVEYALECETPEDVGMGSFRRFDPHEEPRFMGAGTVMFSPQGAKYAEPHGSLEHFIHNPRAIYYFGSDHRHNPAMVGVQKIYIPTPKDAPLWSVQAAGIVLHDLWRRRGDS